MLSISLLSVLLLAGILSLLGVFTIQNSQRRSNLFFSLICYALAIWAIANFFADADHAHSLFWTRLTFVAISLALAALIVFANNFPRRIIRHSSFELALVAGGVVMAIICFLHPFVPQVIFIDGTSNVVTGPLYVVFLAYFFAYFFLAIFLLVRAYRRLTGVELTRLRFVLYGIALMTLVGSATNLILPLALGENQLARYGTFSTLFFTGFTFYAIVRHRLFDIRLVVARSVTYVLLLATLATIYASVMFGVSALFFAGDTSATSVRVIYTALAIILAFTFQPLRRFFERATDRIFYRDRYNSQEVLNRFSKILVSELELDRVLKITLASICHELRIQFGQIIIFNHDRVYRIEHYGPLPKRLMVVPDLDGLGRGFSVADELEDGPRRSLMEEHGVRVSTTLKTRDEFVGYLLLGDKLSGDIYSNQDIELLEIIIKELAVAIMNAKAYAEIAEFNVTLQERVDHATNRLRVANRHLKELDKAKDEFISMASHQLRTPLTTIKGYLSMLLEGDAGHLTHTEKEYVDYAFGASERMVNLISDLLNVSRLSAGRFLIQAKPTDIATMVADEVRQLQSHAAAKNITLKFEPPPKAMAPVELDDNKTRQVVMNFIDNAIYYTKEGGVTVRLTKAGLGARLEVEDTGIGVPEEAKKKLFSKFFRANNAQTVRPDGTGLGLYLARRVVEDQGGTIIFRSTEGHGSTFGFELPFKAAKPNHEGN